MILTNQWTQFAHGHARTELRLLKKLLNSKGAPAKILSISPDFGDICMPVSDFTSMLSRIFARGPLYLPILRYAERRLAKNWQLACEIQAINSILVVSSGFWSQLISTLKATSVKKIFFRLISPPAIHELYKKDIDLVFKAINNGYLTLGIETYDGQGELKTLLNIPSVVVPPLTTINSNYSKKDKLGVIWSVTDSTTISEINTVLKQFKECDLLIKLPIGIELKELECDRSRVLVIPNGISDEDFERELERLNYAYLPHTAYVNRGSGLITSLLGSGVIVFAHRENSFVRDFSFSKLLIPIDSFHMDAETVAALDLKEFQVNRKLEATRVNSWIYDSWSKFLEIENE